VSPLSRPPANLAAFPAVVLPARQLLDRIHRGDRMPWWFSSDGSGRFDLPPPRGTCYLGEEPLASFVEVLRDTTIVSRAVVDQRRLSKLPIPRRIRIADCTARRARSFGITAAIHSGPDYPATREWAAAFADRGFDGVRYYVSHDPEQRLIGIALFGRAGARRWRVTATTAIPEDLIRLAEDEFGILVVPAV
jgi:RES domain-containing protein